MNNFHSYFLKTALKAKTLNPLVNQKFRVNAYLPRPLSNYPDNRLISRQSVWL